MAIRNLFIEKPIAIGNGDGILLYYHYLKNKGFLLTPSTDRMFRFSNIEGVNPALSNVQKWEWSVGGFHDDGNAKAPSAPFYRSWVADYGRYEYGDNNGRFYGTVNAGLTMNLPRYFEQQREKTYRKVLSSKAVKEFLSEISVFMVHGDETTWGATKREHRLWALTPVARIGGGRPEPLGRLFLERLEDEISNEPYINNLGISLADVFGQEGMETLDDLVLNPSHNLVQLVTTLVGATSHVPSGIRDDTNPRSLAPRLVFNALNRLEARDIRFSIENLLARTISSWEYQTSTPGGIGLLGVRDIYSYFKISQQTPFAGDFFTRPYIRQTQPSEEARIIPNYNFYNSNYEKAIAPTEIRETSLTNHYAFQIASRAVIPPDADGDSAERLPSENMILPSIVPHPPTVESLAPLYEHLIEALGYMEDDDETPSPDPEPIRLAGENIFSAVMRTVSLDGQISHDQIIRPLPDEDLENAAQDDRVSGNHSDYYELVARAIAQNQTSAGDLTKTIIIPATEGDIFAKYSNNQYVNPMSLEIQFQKGRSAKAASHILAHRASVGMLCGISSSLGDYDLGRYCVLTTDNLIDDAGSPAKNVLDPTTVDLSFYNPYECFLFGAKPEEIIHPLLISERGLESATGLRPYPHYIEPGNILPPSSFVSFISGIYGISDAEKRNYQQILNVAFPPGEESEIYTHSEAVGYRITKRKLTANPETRVYDRGPIIQNIMLGQTPAGTGDFINYVDSQIKYGEVYEYTLSQFQLIYNTDYEFFMFGEDVPAGLQGQGASSAQAMRQSMDYGSDGYSMTPATIHYTCYTLMRPRLELVEVPVYTKIFYGGQEYRDWDVGSRNPRDRARGISYPPARVLDAPPPFPDLKVLPLKGQKNKVKLVMTPNEGVFEGESALPAVFIHHSETASHIQRTIVQLAYQLEHESPPPKRQSLAGFDDLVDSLNFRGEGESEIKAIKLYRTTHLNHNASNIWQLYDSFNTLRNPDTSRVLTLVNTLFHPDAEINEEEGEVGVLSFDIDDTIESNVTYYYTCVAVDVHDNYSTPSEIFEVRLVFDKGLLLPEVKLYEYNPPPQKIPTRKFARFLQIKPSALQSNPFTELDDNGRISSIRNIAAQDGQSSVTDNRFIVRLTSRDTGRKFDIELDFNYQDVRTEEDEE